MNKEIENGQDSASELRHVNISLLQVLKFHQIKNNEHADMCAIQQSFNCHAS